MALIAAMPLHAQSLESCYDGRASAVNIPDPVGDYTRYFANGAIRVTLLETPEPAENYAWLMIVSPPRDELGLGQCRLLGAMPPGNGFTGIDFRAMHADYDPASGLTLRMPAQRRAPGSADLSPVTLAVTINQNTGDITAGYE
ncbi:hypothetical protein P279_19340 [Rhodobacteraceae bacterium PD-2]|nr:hypothetical protein P279_19340 [Rhodobacteraceae bacterium PD-2]